ncbi:unnamed protein product, partial [Rotaria sordida]
IPKLKYFSLKSRIIGDDELIYLKLIINKVNYIEKLKIRLNIKESMNDNCIIDGNFLDKYLMINILNNLIDFDFYIVSKCKMLFSNDIQKIINSFKIHRFFNDYHWKNIQCFFDKNMSYQHISSNEIIFKPKYFCGIIDYPTIFDWQFVKYISVGLCSSIYLFLKQFDDIFPHINSIQFNMGRYNDLSQSEYSMFLCQSFNEEHDIHFQYVTRLDFGSTFSRISAYHDKSINRNKLRAQVLAYLISMPVRLVYLRIEQFEWFLHLIQYASDKLKKNALSTIRHAEFGLSSCHAGSNESIDIGQNLVPLLGTHMPYLQTLRLWRADDFPWTSSEEIFLIRINFDNYII